MPPNVFRRRACLFSPMTPFLALSSTVIGLGAEVVLRTPSALVLFALGFLTILTVITHSSRGAWFASMWTLPLLLPLGLIHGLINPAFVADHYLFEWVPIRSSGLYFALLIGLRVFILTTIVAIWREVDRDDLFRFSVYIGLPLPVVIMTAVATAVLCSIAMRVHAVYLAQQARGIAAGPDWLSRIRALPTIILPVVTATLIEGSARGSVMRNRGLGSGQLTRPIPVHSVSSASLGWMATLGLTLGFAWLSQ